MPDGSDFCYAAPAAPAIPAVHCSMVQVLSMHASSPGSLERLSTLQWSQINAKAEKCGP